MKNIAKFLGLVTLVFLGIIVTLSIISPELYQLCDDDFDDDFDFGRDENDCLL